jgi:peroxiredoxin
MGARAGRAADVFESRRMDALKVGDTAPDFDLPVSGKERVKLSDALARGPAVLLAYVFDFTGG